MFGGGKEHDYGKDCPINQKGTCNGQPISHQQPSKGPRPCFYCNGLHNVSQCPQRSAKQQN